MEKIRSDYAMLSEEEQNKEFERYSKSIDWYKVDEIGRSWSNVVFSFTKDGDLDRDRRFFTSPSELLNEFHSFFYDQMYKELVGDDEHLHLQIDGYTKDGVMFQLYFEDEDGIQHELFN